MPSEGEDLFTLEIALFHGLEILGKVVETSQVGRIDGSCLWNEKLTLPVEVRKIPKGSKICFCLFQSRGLKKQSVAWTNITVFDHKHFLRTGVLNLPLTEWQSEDDTNNGFNPLGSCLPKPMSILQETAVLTITFQKHEDIDCDQVGNRISEIGLDSLQTSPKRRSSKSHMCQLEELSKNNSLDTMTDQDKDLFRILRANCSDSLPHTLPYVLKSVKWGDIDDVESMLTLIERWPLIPAEVAMSLLDASYPDIEIKVFVVKCLQNFSDDELSLYMLQLAQSLRNELYLYNPLVDFLLRRVLRNRLLGHQLFWILRAGIEDESVKIPFGLLLEAYCWGEPEHTSILAKELESHERVKHLTEQMRRENWRRAEMGTEGYIKYFRDILSQEYYKSSLNGLRLTLDPRIKTGNLVVEKCKLMDSKMQPLWLVLTNSDFGASDFYLIFKNGDGAYQL